VLLCPYDAKSIPALLAADGAVTGCPTSRWGQADPVTAPTLAVSALGAAAAAAQVTWAIEFLLGRGAGGGAREMIFDLRLGAMTSHRLSRNADCLLEHRALCLTPIGGPVEAVSVASVLRLAEARLGPGVTLHLNRRRLVTELRCSVCGAASHPHRLLEAMTEDEARCPEGHIMEPLAFGLRDRLDRHALGPVMGRTWHALGLPPEDVVTATRGGAEIHLLFAPSPASATAEPSGLRMGEDGR
jgi:hypothetical protein